MFSTLWPNVQYWSMKCTHTLSFTLNEVDQMMLVKCCLANNQSDN